MINLKKELQFDENKLSIEYEKALKDEKFLKFINKIKINSSIAQKYTSILESCSLEYDNCISCKGLNECKNKINGYCYLPKTNGNHIIFNYKPCQYKKKQDDKFKYQDNIRYYNVAQEVKCADWKAINIKLAGREKTILWLSQFLNNYPNTTKGLYLSGNTGSGKTYLVISLINELAKKNIRSSIVFWPDFLRNLKSSFDTDFEQKIEYLKKVPVLLIDDLGAETATPWSRDEILCPILQARLNDNQCTFITSNLTIEELKEHLSMTKDGIEIVKAQRILSRIHGLTEEVAMVSKDWRI